MLTQIRCDRFLDEYKIINFNAGLNTVLGSTGGIMLSGKLPSFKSLTMLLVVRNTAKATCVR